MKYLPSLDVCHRGVVDTFVSTGCISGYEGLPLF